MKAAGGTTDAGSSGSTSCLSAGLSAIPEKRVISIAPAGVGSVCTAGATSSSSSSGFVPTCPLYHQTQTTPVLADAPENSSPNACSRSARASEPVVDRFSYLRAISNHLSTFLQHQQPQMPVSKTIDALGLDGEPNMQLRKQMKADKSDPYSFGGKMWRFVRPDGAGSGNDAAATTPTPTGRTGSRSSGSSEFLQLQQGSSLPPQLDQGTASTAIEYKPDLAYHARCAQLVEKLRARREVLRERQAEEERKKLKAATSSVDLEMIEVCEDEQEAGTTSSRPAGATQDVHAHLDDLPDNYSAPSDEEIEGPKIFDWCTETPEPEWETSTRKYDVNLVPTSCSSARGPQEEQQQDQHFPGHVGSCWSASEQLRLLEYHLQQHDPYFFCRATSSSYSNEQQDHHHDHLHHVDADHVVDDRSTLLPGLRRAGGPQGVVPPPPPGAAFLQQPSTTPDQEQANHFPSDQQLQHGLLIQRGSFLGMHPPTSIPPPPCFTPTVLGVQEVDVVEQQERQNNSEQDVHPAGADPRFCFVVCQAALAAEMEQLNNILRTTSDSPLCSSSTPAQEAEVVDVGTRRSTTTTPTVSGEEREASYFPSGTSTGSKRTGCLDEVQLGSSCPDYNSIHFQRRVLCDLMHNSSAGGSVPATCSDNNYNNSETNLPSPFAIISGRPGRPRQEASNYTRDIVERGQRLQRGTNSRTSGVRGGTTGAAEAGAASGAGVPGPSVASDDEVVSSSASSATTRGGLSASSGASAVINAAEDDHMLLEQEQEAEHQVVGTKRSNRESTARDEQRAEQAVVQEPEDHDQLQEHYLMFPELYRNGEQLCYLPAKFVASYPENDGLAVDPCVEKVNQDGLLSTRGFGESEGEIMEKTSERAEAERAARVLRMTKRSTSIQGEKQPQVFRAFGCRELVAQEELQTVCSGRGGGPVSYYCAGDVQLQPGQTHESGPRRHDAPATFTTGFATSTGVTPPWVLDAEVNRPAGTFSCPELAWSL
ncbi:unnamed protein product [Amoebophrya sp. A120]|nr:unnamed protein product [Amoebophrya sp. A120]|eukprot:GSA120T00013478001.1